MSEQALVFEVETTDHINFVAQQMVSLAKEKKCTVTAVFMDVALTAMAETLPAEIVQNYRDELWRESVLRPESEEKTPEMTHCVSKLFDKKLVNLSDLAAAIDWLYRLYPLTRRLGVVANGLVPYERIVEAFKEYGYNPNEYTGEKFDPKDKDVSGRFVIGKALADLLRHPHAISDLFSYHAHEWWERFGDGALE